MEGNVSSCWFTRCGRLSSNFLRVRPPSSRSVRTKKDGIVNPNRRGEKHQPSSSLPTFHTNTLCILTINYGCRRCFRLAAAPAFLAPSLRVSLRLHSVPFFLAAYRRLASLSGACFSTILSVFHGRQTHDKTRCPWKRYAGRNFRRRSCATLRRVRSCALPRTAGIGPDRCCTVADVA